MSTLKDVLLTLLIVVFMVLSVFCLSLSASAAEVESLPDNVIENTVDDLDVESTTVESTEEIVDTSSNDNIELYLQYITGFLLFFVICFLFWAAYKFFNMFF